MRPRPPFHGITVSIALALSLAISSGCGKNPEANPQADSGIPVLVRQAVAVDRAATVRASGTVESPKVVDLAFRVGGEAAQVRVDEGDFVSAGTVLADLDRTEYRLALDAATAAADRARDEHERMKQLYDRGSLAAGDYVKVESAYRQAEANRGQAAEHLAHSTLKAPIAGTVSRRSLEPGEPVAPGVPVFTLVQLDPIEVKVGVPEVDIGGVRAGQTATVQIPALGGRAFEGEVLRVGVVADPAARTYGVEIRVSNPERILRPGMIAEAQIVTDHRREAVTIPGEAVVHTPDGVTQVFVYLPEEKRARVRSVSVGGVLDRQMEITRGLESTEWVVVGGQHRLRDGDIVAPGESAVMAGEIKP